MGHDSEDMIDYTKKIVEDHNKLLNSQKSSTEDINKVESDKKEN